MLKVNLKDGKTIAFDLKDESNLKEWLELSSGEVFQRQITALGKIHNSQWYTLPIPKKFRRISFEAELVENSKRNVPIERKYIGERLKCYADDILISLLVYYGNRPRMSRIDVIKLGKRRFDPKIKNKE